MGTPQPTMAATQILVALCVVGSAVAAPQLSLGRSRSVGSSAGTNINENQVVTSVITSLTPSISKAVEEALAAVAAAERAAAEEAAAEQAAAEQAAAAAAAAAEAERIEAQRRAAQAEAGRQRALRLVLLHRCHWSIGHCRLHRRCERLCRDAIQGGRKSHHESCSCLGWTSCWPRGSKWSCCRGQGSHIFQLKVRFELWIQELLCHHLKLQPERPDCPDPCSSHSSDQLCCCCRSRMKQSRPMMITMILPNGLSYRLS